MNILLSLSEGINLNRLKGASYDKVKNAFCANYLAALILLKIQDLRGLAIINDKAHAKLTSFSPAMSDINFWGRALFFSNDKDVKHRLLTGHGDFLADESGRISIQRVHKLMAVPTTDPDHVDWADTTAAMILLRHRFTLRSSYFDKIVRALYKWDDISDSSKQKAINDSFMYLMQSDPESALLSRMRSLSNSTMINTVDTISAIVTGFKRLHEDGEGGGDAGGAVTVTANIGSVNNIVTLGNNQQANPSAPPTPDLSGLYKLIKVADYQVSKKGRFTVRNGKMIKRRVKSFEPKKFKSPLLRREI